jgi:NAD(P)-dependent dehydrogenase (short-subunit alcohol dehydrogenase family)
MTNQRILIVGGSSGMGLAAAQLLASAGAEVHIAGRDPLKLENAAATIKGKVAAHSVDFSDETSLARLAAKIGRIDHLVLAASTQAAWGPFASVSTDALRKALEGKLIGYWATIQAALPILRRDGSIVLLTGGASRTAIPNTAGLAAVNGAITQMAQTLAKELAPLRVNVVSPGLVDTPAYDGMPAEAKAAMFKSMAATSPVGRTGTPADIASAVFFLIENTFTTGALLDVDGGAR